MHGLYFIAHSKPTKQKRFEFQKGISMITCVCLKTLAERHGGDCKAGESRGRAPEQASDYALRAPNPLDSSAMTRCFIKILGLPNQSGSQVFCPHAPPPLAGLGWLANIPHVYNVISHGLPSFTLTTDASLSGWGAVFHNKRKGGTWSEIEKNNHINYLERLALFLGLQTYCKGCFPLSRFSHASVRM